jgi:hypothetical protein
MLDKTEEKSFAQRVAEARREPEARMEEKRRA